MAKSPSSRKPTKKPVPKKSGKAAKRAPAPKRGADTTTTSGPITTPGGPSSTTTAGPTTTTTTSSPPFPTGDSCCTVCDTAATGTWGIPWRDAGGNWQCLIGPTAVGADKVLRCDNNGPFWGNP